MPDCDFHYDGGLTRILLGTSVLLCAAVFAMPYVLPHLMGFLGCPVD